MSAHPTLASLHALLLSALSTWMDELRAGTLENLPILAREGAPAAACADVAAVLRRHLPLWTQAVAEALHDWPERPMLGLPRQGGNLLQDEDEVEASAALLRLAEVLEVQQAPRLGRLRQRLLAAGGAAQQALRPAHDPLQPEGLLHAAWTGSAALDLDPAARYLLLRAAAGPLLGFAVSALAHLEVALPVQELPALPERPGDATPQRRAWPVGPPTSGLPLYRAGSLDRLRVRILPHVDTVGPVVAHSLRELDELICRIVSSTAPVPGPEGSSRLSNPVLDCLPLIQAVARHDADRQVIELIARLFDTLLSDPQLPLLIRHRLGLLQLPVLRIALAEPRVLDSASHPAWRLIDRIGRHTLGFSDDDDPRLHRAAEGIEWVCDRLCSRERPSATAFESALGVLEQILAGELALELQQRTPERERLAFERRLRSEQAVHRRRIQARLMEQEQVHAEPVDPLLRSFLFGIWPRALARMALDENEGRLRAEALEQVVARLLDSLRTASGPGLEPLVQRRELTELAERLQHGCAEIGVPEARQEAVFDCLWQGMERRLPAPRGEDGAAEPAELAAAGVLSFFELGHPLDEPVPEAAARPPRDWLHRLKPGEWCRLPVDGRWRVLRLLEPATGDQPWLFSEAGRDRCHAFSRRALERLVQAGLAGPYEGRSLLERAVDGLLAGER